MRSPIPELIDEHVMGDRIALPREFQQLVRHVAAKSPYNLGLRTLLRLHERGHVPEPTVGGRLRDAIFAVSLIGH